MPERDAAAQGVAIPDRAALVTHARDTIARGSKSFAAASRLFDRTTRERVWLLYAWCRRCDDIVDAQDHGGALASITPTKQRRIVFAARHFLLKLRQIPPCRFDIVAVEGEDLHWFKAAFNA